MSMPRQLSEEVVHVEEKLLLNDPLALFRTRLATERTWLSYVRTGLALLIAGLTLIRFFENETYRWLGVAMTPVSLAVFLLGYFRYHKRTRYLDSLERKVLAKGQQP